MPNSKCQILNAGQSLFEVIVAVAISAVIMVSLVSLVTNSIQNANFSRNKSQAGILAQQTTEWLRGQRDSNPSVFATNIQTLNWCMVELSWGSYQAHPCVGDETVTGTLFRRQITFETTQVDVGGIFKLITQADIVVTWDDSQGSHEVRSSTNFSDWRER